jgi:predicted RNA-binding protein Jag
MEAPKGHDESKRLFLRMAGLAGVGVIAAAVLPKKAEAYVLGSAPTTGIVGMKNASNVRIDPATETTLAGIKTKSDKLSFDVSNNLQVGGAIGVQNVGGSAINPATEDTLALIKAQADKLTFDGSNQLLTTSSGGGGTASVVGLKDTSSNTINPASDDAIIYLRRMVKLMESQATVDSANRQRVSIDAGTLPTVGTVSSITTITNAVPVGNVATFDGYNRQMFQDVARNAYANGLRQNLIFS